MGNIDEKSTESRARTGFLAQTVFGTSFSYLTSGVFLSGLALLMGAGDLLTGYLSVIVNICGILILVFASYLEHFRSRRRLTITLTILSRITTLLIVIIPALVPEHLQLILFVPAVIAAFTLQAQTTVVLNQWMMEFVSERTSGRYISLRQTLTLLVTVILSVTGGLWMDTMQGRYTGFVILFAVAGLMSILEVLLLLRTPDSKPYLSDRQVSRQGKKVWLPLKNRCFTGFVLYILSFYLLLNISDSFTTVYMLKYLALPYRTVTSLSLLLSLPQVVLLSIWGKICDKKGNAFVLETSIWLFAGETLFLFFASPDSWYLFIPLAFLTASAANAGFVISVFARRYELMPKTNRVIYDNFYTAAIGIGFILGPLAGGVIKNMLGGSKVLPDLVPFADIRFLYLISTAGILSLQIVYHHMQRKKEHRLLPCC